MNSGNDPPEESDWKKNNSQKVVDAPLTEEEYSLLQMNLDGNISSFTRLLNDPVPSSSRTNEFLSDNHALLQLERVDTFENTAGFVRPTDIHVDKKKESALKVEGGDGFQNNLLQEQLVFHDTNGITFVESFDQQWGNLSLSPFTSIPSSLPSLPTSANPATTPFPGSHDFRCVFERLHNAEKNKAWEFSTKLNKLYIEFDKKFQIGFKIGPNPSDGLYVRALAVYAEAESVTEPVIRCPNHAAFKHATNVNFDPEYRYHLIRVEHESAMYCCDEKSKRLSVLVPLSKPHIGTDICPRIFKFMCLGSDSGGINRRPVKLVFTLEHGINNVIGRYSFDLRICANPARDMRNDEEKFKKDELKVIDLAGEIARSNSVIAEQKSGKKRKLNDLEEMIMLPVSKEDYAKLNEFAEAAMIMRDPDKKELIRQKRKKLLAKYNDKSLLTKKKPRDDSIR